MRLRLDLHVHTFNSPDGFTALKAAAEAAMARGLDGLAITDHEKRTDLRELDSMTDRIIVLPGVEVKVRRYHVLGIGVDHWQPERCATLEEAVRRIHQAGGLAVLAHPYLSLLRPRSLEEVRAAGLDAVEAVNSGVQLFSLGTMLASRAAEALKLPKTGGSDSHIPETVGDGYTIVEARGKEPRDLLDAIREGRTIAYGRATGLRHRLRKLLLQLRKTRATQ